VSELEQEATDFVLMGLKYNAEHISYRHPNSFMIITLTDDIRNIGFGRLQHLVLMIVHLPSSRNRIL
jgi:hypothetical protein